MHTNDSTSAALAADESGGVERHPSFARVLTAASVGNVLEWYDWGAFAFLVSYIAANFFPSQDPTAALLSTFATFGVGFVARPVGALAIGWIGDRYGRKVALMTTIYLMAAGTVAIAFIPSFNTIGIWAPILLVTARLLQGLSTGGELGGSIAFMIEWAPANRRGFYTSFQQSSTIAGLLLGSGLAAVLNTLLDSATMADWGWRLPFIFGGILLPVGIWMRGTIEETPVYRKAQALTEPAPQASIGAATRMVLNAIGLGICWTSCQYLILTYMATYTAKFGGLTQTEALWSNTAGLVVAMAFTPFWGYLSDRIGRRPLLLVVNVFFMVAGYLAFSFIASMPGLAWILATQCLLAVFMAIHTGVGPSAIAEIFPTHSRSFLASMAFALVVTIFGGFSPYIATWLIQQTGSAVSPSIMLLLTGLVATATTVFSKETAHLGLK
jgi:MHS family proline/betaine transporter-like MFS transporter